MVVSFVFVGGVSFGWRLIGGRKFCEASDYPKKEPENDPTSENDETEIRWAQKIECTQSPKRLPYFDVEQ